MLQVTGDARTRMEVEGLIEAWQQRRDGRAFERLLKMHKNIITEEARRVRWPGSEYADRVAAGHEGFLVAANDARVGHGEASFATFCRLKIKSYITIDRRNSIVGDPSRRMGEPDQPGTMVPIDVLADILPDPAPSPEQVALTRCDARAVREALAVLSAKQRRCIEIRYIDGDSAADAASVLGIAERHVKRLTREALDIIRAHMAGEEVLDGQAQLG